MSDPNRSSIHPSIQPSIQPSRQLGNQDILINSRVFIHNILEMTHVMMFSLSNA
jgi:hypothetical protein